MRRVHPRHVMDKLTLGHCTTRSPHAIGPLESAAAQMIERQIAHEPLSR